MFRTIVRVLLPLCLCVFACTNTPEKKSHLTILLPDDILSVEPNRDFEVVTDAVLFNVFEPLVGFDANLNLEPVLAESWENPRPEQWVFQLRKNVRFQDGTPMDAGIVRDLMLKVKGKQDFETANFLSLVQDITAINSHTLSITTVRPLAILSKLPFVSIAKPAQAGAFPPYIGTGPYRIVDWTHGKRIELESWPDYWGRKPQFSHVAFVPVRDSAERLRLLSEGKADIVYWVSPASARTSQKDIRFQSRPGMTVYYVGFNFRKKSENPFLDPRVRKAIHLALNRTQIVDSALLGKGSIPTQPVAPYVFGYDPQIPPPSYDPEAAMQLMKEAGHTGGFSVRLDFNEARRPVAEIIRDSLGQIGIRVELNPIPRDALYRIAQDGLSDFFMAGWDCSSGDAGEFFEFCLHTQANDFGMGNFGAYSNAEIDHIAQINSSVIDQKERKKLLQRALGITMDELPLLPLYIEDDVYGMRSEFSFETRADGEIKLLDIAYATK